MNKNLPKVFVSPINKELRNNKDIYYGKNEEDRGGSPVNVLKKINEVFANPHHVYKSKVVIKTKDNVVEDIIVGKTEAYLLTLKGDKININEIIDIDRR